MSEEAIKEIFITIASKAMESGKEIRLEKGRNKSENNTLGGAFAKSSTDYDSLSLVVYGQSELPGETEDADDECEET